ncbi:lipoate--protein ligase family protein [Stratiformator vulcanicus]|uniref:Putative lipoate-protein ligase A n=1 Tax=Stratiformator vulcanicus TaxID=2527980 RepID=A0A517R7K5_9PLAN|nr:lipoate--protein ligase family protein [Stratiformator vulcanicus]QDT39870.1 putative lipoate-protein ligase A [Stratiformator vulcanicus]
MNVGPCRLLERTHPDCAADLACDELLLRDLDQHGGEPILRLWERPDEAVVLGRANRVSANVSVEACLADGVPILRRCSGGGTVMLGPGCLCYSLFIPIDPGVAKDIHGSISAALEPLAHSLSDALTGGSSELTPDVAGTSDLVIDAVKFSGNAQRWLKHAMLHHGTLLYDFDLDRIGRYLTKPERSPEYRTDRTHGEFVRNLPLRRAAIRSAVIAAYQATAEATIREPNDAEIQSLVNERYATRDWTWSRA